MKNWDFNWQEQYTYKAPIHLPEGTIVKAKFVYDNSEDNPRNPSNPPRRVTFGEQTTDEMAILFFGGTLKDESERQKYLRGLLLDHLGTVADIARKQMGQKVTEFFHGNGAKRFDVTNVICRWRRLVVVTISSVSGIWNSFAC